MGLILTDGQKNAVMKALYWYYGDREKNIFVVAGVAGSGKSTTVSTMVETLGLQKYQVLYATYTGKAASVLRMKGCLANTIHRTFYVTRQDPGGKVFFIKKKSLPSTIKLIVIDELSMVNAKLMEDIISFGIPVIGIGDPLQLPPMYGENPYIQNYDVFLDQVMRQQGTSGILDLAMMARRQEEIPVGQYKESRVITLSKLHDIEKYDVVLCWRNSTRRELNNLIRKKLGRTTKYPVKGEKLICLKNNYVHIRDYQEDIPIMLVNGLGLVNCSDAKYDEEDGYLKMKYATPFMLDNPFETRVSTKLFDAEVEGLDVPDTAFTDIPEDVAVLSYGYANTTHKSQGSEWPNVLCLDEFKGSKDMYYRFLYTQITRAKNSVTIVKMF
jgi:exodeoxyribonuclease-5